MGKEPLVSVVIVNWNRKEDLRECLESLRNQTYINIEIIVVDNCSTDGSIEMIKRDFPEIKLIVMPDSSYGACECCNIGFANAEGKYVVILDNDVILDRNWIQNVVNKFENNEKIGIFASKILNYYTHKISNWHYPLDQKFAEIEFESTTFIGCAAAIRKKIINKIGGYPKEFFIYANEQDLAIRVLDLGYKIVYYPKIVAYHKIPPNHTSRETKRKFFYTLRNDIWFYWKYFPINYALKKTVLRIGYGVRQAIRYRYIVTMIYSLLDCIIGLPRILRSRKVVKDKTLKYLLRIEKGEGESVK
ncbi:MAG: glycosyltransferase family 2 protein [Candidatus Methanospirare jalkutatii]|nr:MAG: glycosyltransferase family 2 protein [Candidatus Methanospirare jalkutatii]UYZ40901.1 MAG: glycosyltransferase family 2 protein [Candidatus Methanospirare jalkutatii]